jgi:hypothetical protein
MTVLVVRLSNKTMKEYLSTDPTICTPVSPTTIIRNLFETTWQASLRDSSEHMQKFKVFISTAVS